MPVTHAVVALAAVAALASAAEVRMEVRDAEGELDVHLVLPRKMATYHVPVVVGDGVHATDGQGRVWALAAPLQLTATAPEPPRTYFRLEHAMDFALAYEEIENVSDECAESHPDGGVRCCPSANGVLRYTLRRNETLMSAYRVVEPASRRLRFELTLAQVGGTAMQASVPLDEVRELNPSPTATATITVANATGVEHLQLSHLPHSPFYLVAEKDRLYGDAFLVPSAAFGQGRRQLGMSNASWHACFSCTKPRGKCPSLATSSLGAVTYGAYDPNDQLYRYRDPADLRTSLADAASSDSATCAPFPNNYGKMLGMPTSYESVFCETGGVIVITARLVIGTDVLLKELRPARPRVVEMSLEPIADLAPIDGIAPAYALAVAVVNDGDLPAAFRVDALACCLIIDAARIDEARCTSSDVPVGQPTVEGTDRPNGSTRTLSANETDAVVFHVRHSLIAVLGEQTMGTFACGVRIGEATERWTGDRVQLGHSPPPTPPFTPPPPPPSPTSPEQPPDSRPSVREPPPTPIRLPPGPTPPTSVPLPAPPMIPSASSAQPQSPPMRESTSSCADGATPPSCGIHGRLYGCTCTCDDGWETSFNQDLANFQWCSHRSELSRQREVPNGTSHTIEPADDSVRFDTFRKFWPPGPELGLVLGIVACLFGCCVRFMCLRARQRRMDASATALNAALDDKCADAVAIDDSIFLDMSSVHLASQETAGH